MKWYEQLLSLLGGLCLFMLDVGVPSTCLPQDVSRSGVKPRTRVWTTRQWRRRRQNSAIHSKLAAPMAEWCDPHLAEAKTKTIWEDFRIEKDSDFDN